MNRWSDDPASPGTPITASPDLPGRPMKLRFLILIVLAAVMVQPVLSQQAEKPLTKNQIMDLVKAGMDNTQLA